MASNHMKTCSNSLPPVNYKLKQSDTIIHLLEWRKSKTLTTPNAARMWSSSNYESLLVGMQTVNLEDNLAAYYKTYSYDPAVMLLCICSNDTKT